MVSVLSASVCVSVDQPASQSCIFIVFLLLYFKLQVFIYFATIQQSHLFFAMDYLSGGDLFSHCSNGVGVGLERAR